MGASGRSATLGLLFDFNPARIAFLSGEPLGREEASRMRLERSEAVRLRAIVGGLLTQKGKEVSKPQEF
jgi:hypothetical protein